MGIRNTLGACGLLALVGSGCASAGPTPPADPAPATVERTHAPYVEADVAFMQGMIAHHGQALEMTSLAPARTTNATLLSLAERIDLTQQQEIARMTRWLDARGETAPEPAAYREHADHGAHAGHMPGMLTPEQMARLASASGSEFDALFLESMIRHHEGALTMVAELQAAGGGLEPEIFRFAADVDADQRAEIARMQSLLTRIRGAE
ncbi:MAG TPA: DUF305 domain-containing protein [Longimicrobiales bacterium]